MFGAEIILLDQVDSTNTYARNNFDRLSDGAVVFAAEQSAGRGRLGRNWVSSRNQAIMASAVFKNIQQPFHAGIVTGLAGLELVREYVPQAFSFLKWPNDIYVDDCKISGILSEGVIGQGRFQGVVSGIGININNPMDELRRMGVRAVSLCEISGEKFFLEKMRFELAKKLAKYYIMCQSHLQSLLDLWRHENRLLGECLVLDTPSGEQRRGIFYDLAETGEMLIRDDNGTEFRFDCGDVKIDTELIDFKSLKEKYNNQNK